MAVTLYRQIYQEMLTSHQDDFTGFKKIHDLFHQDEARYQDEFNRLGKPILRLIEEYENRLCRKMERTNPAYSAKLSEKFRDLIRRDYPLIDMVGLEFS